MTVIMHESPATIQRALDCGAKGYVTKREEPAILLEGVDRVLRGETYVRPSPATTQDVESPTGAVSVKEGLSRRERQILELMGQGEMNTEIAQALHIGARTVETYYLRIMRFIFCYLTKEREQRSHHCLRTQDFSEYQLPSPE